MTWQSIEAAATLYDAGLRSPEPAEPTPIDPERLARAIDAAWRREDRNPHAFGASLADEGRVLARAIVAEWPDA